MARVLAALFVGCGLLAPSAGAVLAVLPAPFFAGEEFQAYFWLPESLVYATLAGATLRVVRMRRRPWVPAAPVAALFLASTVLMLRPIAWLPRDQA